MTKRLLMLGGSGDSLADARAPMRGEVVLR
jgi:hypothetical protein